MAHRNTGRIDRFAQMSKQEELIAKKRQEILEKQRTSTLAKAVQAAQTLAAAQLKTEIDEKQKGNDERKDESETATLQEDSDASSLLSRVKKDDTNVADASASSSATLKSTPTPAATTAAAPSKSHGHGVNKSNIGKISFGLKRTQPSVIPVAEQPPAKVQNSFCNDGSFLENFKKILEKHEKPKIPMVALEAPPADATETTNDDAESAASTGTTTIPESETTVASSTTESNQQQQQPQQHQHHLQQHGNMIYQQHQYTAQQQQPPGPPPPPQFLYNTNMMRQPMMPAGGPPPPHHHHHHPQQHPHHGYAQHLHQFQQQQHPPPPPTSVAGYMQQSSGPPPPPQQQHHHHPHHLQQPPTQHSHHAAAAAAAAMSAAFLHVVPPPPPPPPQLPLALANMSPLYMIPAPEPMQLNAIPPPKEFDLNVIPKPQLNLEAIQVPVPVPVVGGEEQQQQQQQQEDDEQEQQLTKQNERPQTEQSDNNDHNCIELPTTVESLIDTVAGYGGDVDECEDKMRTHKNDLQPALWFLFDKNCEQYQSYRRELMERRLQVKDQGTQAQQLKVPKVEMDGDEQKHSVKKEEQTDDDAEDYNNDNATTFAKHEERKVRVKQEDDDVVRPCFSGGLPKVERDTDEKYDPETAISADIDSDDEYMRGMMTRNRDNIKRRIECRNELSEEERQEREAEQEEERRRLEKKKLRKSRWGDKVAEINEDTSSSSVPTSFVNQNKPMLSKVTRNDPALLQYARLNYGSTTLSEEDWRKCEEHYKVNLLYQDMMRKRQEIDRLARTGKFKYEYDSDEDVEGGTWEHKLRCAEMEATQVWAAALTKQSEGKHHIGDFLPPEELKKFMEQYEAKKSNRQPDLSDYKEYKLKEDNIGFQMLQKLGWKEGQGLGQDGAGIVDPVNKAPQREGNQGLGIASAATPEDCDNEYDAYRKRMMLAYRFRPNPLNNPRRAYY